MRRLASLVALLAAPFCAATASAQATITPGNGQATASLPGIALNVFTYRPTSCTPQQLLFVFHGLGRDAGPYRDYARGLADHLCAIAVVPEFDSERFPTAAYQRGGDTVHLVNALVDWARAAVGHPEMPFSLIGHSAGAQFLSRVAAYSPTAATHVVIANPSTWVQPSLAVASPYGFGGMANGEQAMRVYLALPVVVLLGGADTGTKNLSVTKEAMAQGPNRLERGRSTFEMAQSTAQKHGWPFAWTLVEVPGVGHDTTKMFSAPQTEAALRR